MTSIKKVLVSLFMLIVRAIVETYTKLTLPIYRWIQKPEKRMKKASEHKSRQIDATDPYSPWISTRSIPFHILSTCETAHECVEMAKKLYSHDRPAFGYREVLSEEVVTDSDGNQVRMDGKVLRKFRLTDYQWISYGEAFECSEFLAKGMLANGFERKSKVVSLIETNPLNIITGLALESIGGILISVFPTLGDKEIIEAINETQAKYLYTSYDLFAKVNELIPHCTTIEVILYIPSLLSTNNNNSIKFAPHLKVITTEKLLEDGKKAPKELKGVPLSADEVGIIGYTSGTGGAPKGVYGSFAQAKQAALALLTVAQKFMDCAERHTYVAYLPQTHVLEASIELMCFFGGVKIGFATPFTLNESAPGLADGEVCDLKLLKPTIMAAVPLVLERMRKEMYNKLENRTPVSTDLFNYLIDYKIKWTKKGYNTPIVNFLVCPKVKEQFGGKLEHMVVGGAPLSPQLQALIKASLNCTLAQGFGATETSGAVMCMEDSDLSYGRVGAPLNGIKAKLIDWSEGGYNATDKPNPRGEIIVGSKSVALGYYNNKQLTDQSFTFEAQNSFRWFNTGDIGEVFPDGTFKIIDRRKDLIKLANGEYFSLGKIESALKNCAYVENICICGDAMVNSLVALITPNKLSIEKLRKTIRISESSANFENICSNVNVIEVIHKSLVDTAIKQQLNRREVPVVISLCAEEWTPDNGLLTATMKLKRKCISHKYRKQIDTMFGMCAKNAKF